MAPSKAVESRIRARAAKLDQFYDKIMGCRVLVEAPHCHHYKGKRFHVRIDVTVPGGELVIKREPKLIGATRSKGEQEPNGKLAESREPSKYGAHADIYIAIHDAFDAARRKLQDYARRRRGAVKVRAPLPQGQGVGKQAQNGPQERTVAPVNEEIR